MKANSPITCIAVVVIAILHFEAVQSTCVGADFFGPTAYLSRTNSPFLANILAGATYLETFEDGALDTPGVRANRGAVSANSDSVDADDGAIDGSGSGGHSYYSYGPDGPIIFAFDEAVLGGYPTHAGIVWTDGNQNATVTFEAFDYSSNSLGTVVAVVGDDSIWGTTAEDRFFGVTNAAGISAIAISITGGTPVGGYSGGIEVDHLQYGGVNRLIASIRCSQVEICWNSLTNVAYQVEYRSELTTNQWTDLFHTNIIATSSVTCVFDNIPHGLPQRFYRVLRAP